MMCIAANLVINTQTDKLTTVTLAHAVHAPRVKNMHHSKTLRAYFIVEYTF